MLHIIDALVLLDFANVIDRNISTCIKCEETYSHNKKYIKKLCLFVGDPLKVNTKLPCIVCLFLLFISVVYFC